jgi:5-hydroxyisourate hydrolase
MASLSTHVLDTALGHPAVGMAVELSAQGTRIGGGTTDQDGRIGAIGPRRLEPGDYVLTFDTGRYHRSGGRLGFYPTVSIEFTITEEEGHYHVPLLLSPFGYATYRGS